MKVIRNVVLAAWELAAAERTLRFDDRIFINHYLLCKLKSGVFEAFGACHP